MSGRFGEARFDEAMAEAGYGCAHRTAPGVYCGVAAEFAVLLAGEFRLRKAVMSCGPHLGEVIWQLIALHAGYRGEFIVLARTQLEGLVEGGETT